MQYDPTNPLIIQGDRSILVEVNNPKYAAARDALAPFAELEKSPEHIHTYRLTNLSLWNAAAAGLTAAQMVKVLRTFTKFPIPHNVAPDIEEVVQRYGRVRLERSGDQLKLVCPDKPLLAELLRQKKVAIYLGDRLDEKSFQVDTAFRGVLKQALVGVGYPAEDLAGYTEGADLALGLRNPSRSGIAFNVRDYQKDAC
ncbi:MAG TPA: helicase-associated domain-containing protein, partial [Gemmatales bacterium]|nr:helicase-associated domain-containing protein [Gemmatales bacterium]